MTTPEAEAYDLEGHLARLDRRADARTQIVQDLA
jgi:hypothetical protein